MCVPAPAVGEYVTEQLDVVLLPTWASVQLADGVKLPDEAPLLKLAVPCGHEAVPESESDTVAVQVVDPLIGLLDGAHDVAVDVVRSVTVNANPVASVLSAWVASFAV